MYDVAIIGGGPAGSTAGSLLKKYRPDLNVIILEKTKFPRDHVGESQLPLIGVILDEMGCWDKVEAANFPIKVGAIYTWGRSQEPWHFNFIPPEQFQDTPRPALFEGQRRYTAFQVERSIYDDILLRHAEELGCEVREETIVDEVLTEGDDIAGLKLRDGETITAKHYIDSSGNVGLIRRAFDVEVQLPDKLRNVAFWDYWDNAEWAEEIGVGGTRIQIRSLPYGWLWFIPLGPTRTSIGLVCHTNHYVKSQKNPDELYAQAIADEPAIAKLVANATQRGNVESTRDWSYLASRMVGSNWFLTGEAAGFADPILSAGMTLAHTSARDAAYTILELERGEHEVEWLRQRFDEKNRTSIDNHIRFAIYWYSANGLQTDLQEHCRELARSAGLRLNAKDAFRWISQGAFATELIGNPSIGFFDITSIHDLANRFSPTERRHDWLIDGCSEFKLNIHNATQSHIGELQNGRIIKIPCLVKGDQKLPLHEFYRVAVEGLQQTSDAETFVAITNNTLAMLFPPEHRNFAHSRILEVLESMALDGWVICKKNKKRPPLVMNREATTIN